MFQSATLHGQAGIAQELHLQNQKEKNVQK